MHNFFKVSGAEGELDDRHGTGMENAIRAQAQRAKLFWGEEGWFLGIWVLLFGFWGLFWVLGGVGFFVVVVF